MTNVSEYEYRPYETIEHPSMTYEIIPHPTEPISFCVRIWGINHCWDDDPLLDIEGLRHNLIKQFDDWGRDRDLSDTSKDWDELYEPIFNLIDILKPYLTTLCMFDRPKKLETHQIDLLIKGFKTDSLKRKEVSVEHWKKIREG